MFEKNTYEKLMEEVLNAAPEDIDTRQGSIFYDAVSGVVLKIAKFYTDLEYIFSLSQLSTTCGIYLDEKASEYGVKRHEALKAKYYAEINGIVDENERFFYDGLYFKLIHENEAWYFEAEEAGIQYNQIMKGSRAVPVDTISGLKSSIFGDIYAYGSEIENDENLRRRIYDKISGNGENGNKGQYKIWCESIDGVSLAKIFPLWNGPNTVKAVLINAEGIPCDDMTVNAVQQYIDPDSLGLGEGVAPIGAHFTASAALTVNINVAVKLETTADITLTSSKIQSELKSYFKSLVLNSNERNDIVIRLSGVGAVISGIAEVIDYSELTLNGLSENIIVNPFSVPILEEVKCEIL